MVGSLVWFRDDLRLADNPALDAAVAQGGRITALYVLEQAAGLRPLGGAASWWLGKSLASLAQSLDAVGIDLQIETGDPRKIVPAAAKRLSVANVLWNRRYAPGARAIDSAIKTTLQDGGIKAISFPGNVLAEPWNIKTGSGGAFQVYTPFARVVRQWPIAFPLPNPVPRDREPSEDGVATSTFQSKWAKKLEHHWSVGETGALLSLLRFFDEALADYVEDRDRPDQPGTSVLSPHLRFGEISARQVWHATQAVAANDPAKGTAVEKFLSELIWRDFNYHQLYHRPDIANIAMRDTLAGFEWRDDQPAFAAWKLGRTGIPIIDAGMRQLWETGWMHNRVRMLVASFLTKNLLIDWRRGEQWFWVTLVDADVASNPGNWQWVAGCGMDAAPYFRIFNPLLQGERFDPTGTYVRQWLPELAGLPDAWIHRPSEAPKDVLASAGVVLGETYPRPLVDLKASQRRARESFASLKA
ncbi:cryptochrome/photolyase family protein [Aminobacter sp. MET-1]|uniref:cryptochrome/photolyase family protein n=1 Tax=Aminobacter sp. MET-1 TaxID=2951085 RepID=UPI00226A1937|nr:deoxyribodipyrimidine photo-lyase [Aminobacter sp. MET-1]MCX8570878.1 DNA photolyase family protein [Aminobacter sp. MET-1]